MSALTVVLAGLGVWLIVEGAIFALAPGAMRALVARLAATPPRDLVLAGLSAAALGALLLTIAVRTA